MHDSIIIKFHNYQKCFFQFTLFFYFKNNGNYLIKFYKFHILNLINQVYLFNLIFIFYLISNFKINLDLILTVYFYHVVNFIIYQ